MSLLKRIERVNSTGDVQAGPIRPRAAAPRATSTASPRSAGRSGATRISAPRCARVQDKLLAEIGPNVDFTQTPEMRKKI
jgi:hypothetical protein